MTDNITLNHYTSTTSTCHNDIPFLFTTRTAPTIVNTMTVPNISVTNKVPNVTPSVAPVDPVGLVASIGNCIILQIPDKS